MNVLLRALFLMVAGAAGVSCAGRFSLSDPGNHSDPPPPPAPLAGEHPTVGLVSAVGGVGHVRLEWKRQAQSEEALEIAAFVATDRATLFDTTPIPLSIADGHALVEGLVGSQPYVAGLGVRSAGAVPYTPCGPVLKFHTGAPIYVNPAFDPGSGDGASPATAFGDLTLGALIATATGGGNVWVAEGACNDITLPLYTGVYLYGGFRADFDPARRNAATHATRLNGAFGQNIVEIHHGNFGPAVLDGVTLVGAGLSTDGIQDLGHELEAHLVVIDGCKRGIKLLAAYGQPVLPVLITGCTVTNSTLEGVLLDGPLDVVVESSSFSANGNEGLALQDLRAPELGSASLVARASSFRANGQEGLDCHLATEPGSGSGGGSFRVRVQDCDFEENAFDGMRVDIAYDAQPQWSSSIEVRGCRSRANRQAGLHLDLDSSGDALVQRVSATANGGDGILVTSSTLARMALVSDCALLGNQGWGLRGDAGACALCASGCVFAGNTLGGMQSVLAPASLASSLAYLQPEPWPGATLAGCVVEMQSSNPACLNLPTAWARIVAQSGGVLSLDRALDVQPAIAEVADDGQARTAQFLAADALQLDPPPTAALPALLALFPGEDVHEDCRLAPESAAVGAGWAAPFAPAVDAGPFASSLGGLPGRDDAQPRALFRLADTLPAWGAPLAPTQALVLRFADGTPDEASLGAGLWSWTAQGLAQSPAAFVVDDTLVVPAPAGGWQDGQRLGLFPALRATHGGELLGPIVLPIRTR